MSRPAKGPLSPGRGRIGRLAGVPVLALVLVLGLAMLPAMARAQGADIPWRAGETFTRTSVNDDVKNVLRGLLASNGLSVIFRPGVEGSLSFAFQDAPVAAAFQQIVDENNLTVAYNPATRTVVIGPGSGSATSAAARRFVALRNVGIDTIEQALANFAIDPGGISYDAATATLAVQGTPEYVNQILELVRTLEERGLVEAQADQALEARLHAARPTPIEQMAIEQEQNLQVKVIRLRFADVGPSTRQFHGRTISVPGILDTLRAMLGMDAAPAGSGADGTSFTPAQPIPATVRLIGPYGAPQPAAEPAPFAPVERPGPVAAVDAIRSLGRPTISIDQRTNSVIVRGTPQAIAAVEAVIRELDQPVKMIEIEVVIATAQIGVSEQLGVNWRASLGNVAIDTGTTGGRATGSTPRVDAITLLPIAPTPGGTAASFVIQGGEGFLQAQLRLLASENKARVLSAPHLVTLDNVTARITRSQDLYVPVDTGGLNGQGLSQIQTGLTLEITPSLVPALPGAGEELVRLSVNAVNSQPGSGSTGQLDVLSQEVQTDVRVPDGGTFVIGGLFDNSRIGRSSGVPVLKDIPVMGALFRDDATTDDLGETIFFITPRIVDEQRVLARDIAAAAEPMGYVQQQRQLLRGVTNQIDHGTAADLPDTARLEEDE
ncbi:type II secretion system protein GspD [Zavarzinia sp. CC-PAN008]|uniref:type II secretion system protein GspD n=1 Tax=Zavarzinia sp. CC-PAN008 TaxID=3243332 RepID=UPI003F7457E3